MVAAALSGVGMPGEPAATPPADGGEESEVAGAAPGWVGWPGWVGAGGVPPGGGGSVGDGAGGGVGLGNGGRLGSGSDEGSNDVTGSGSGSPSRPDEGCGAASAPAAVPAVVISTAVAANPSARYLGQSGRFIPQPPEQAFHHGYVYL